MNKFFKTLTVITLNVCLVITAVFTVVHAATPTPDPKVPAVAWQYQRSLVSTDLAFIVYCSPSLSAPWPWPIITNTPGTNVVTSGASNSYLQKLNLPPGQYFFIVQSSNEWGLSYYSNVATTSPAPVPAQNVSAQAVNP